MQIDSAVSVLKKEVTMEQLKIFISIEDPKSRQNVSIRGSLDILRAFLSGVSMPVMQPITNPPATNDADPAQAGIDNTNSEKGD